MTNGIDDIHLIYGLNMYIGALAGRDPQEHDNLRKVIINAKKDFGGYLYFLIEQIEPEFDEQCFEESGDGALAAGKWLKDRLESDGYLEARINAHNEDKNEKTYMWLEDPVCLYRAGGEIMLPKARDYNLRYFLRKNSELVHTLADNGLYYPYSKHFVFITNIVLTIRNWPFLTFDGYELKN